MEGEENEFLINLRVIHQVKEKKNNIVTAFGTTLVFNTSKEL